jgi:hypothetical protein
MFRAYNALSVGAASPRINAGVHDCLRFFITMIAPHHVILYTCIRTIDLLSTQMY